MTKNFLKAVLCGLVLTGLPALAQAQTPNTCDFDGDGITDRTVVRNTGGGPSGQITWYILRSSGGVSIVNWGIVSDTFLCGDYDADGKSDVTVWRPGVPGVAGFWVLQSSDGAAFFEPFGQTGDNAALAGDFNGDGRDDFVVYRGGVNTGDPSFYFYRTTRGGPVTYLQWGKSGDFPTTLDIDGDGKHDVVAQRGGGIQAQIWIQQSSNGAVSVFNFGLSTDIMVPGHYDADATEDFTVVRASGGQWQWWTRASSNGAISARLFGASATDYTTQGDWDGDGRTDVGIWRNGQFWTLGSTAGLAVVQWGTTGDYPVNTWRRQ